MVDQRTAPYRYIIPTSFVIAILGISVAVFAYFLPRGPGPIIYTPHRKESLPTFASCNQIAQTLKEAQKEKRSLEDVVLAPFVGMAPKQGVAIDSAGGRDFSTTNVQVEGVDEADIVKTDGTYIYTVSGREVIISRAYPPDQAMVLSRIQIDNGRPQEIFIHKDNILIFGTRNSYYMGENYYEEEFYPYDGGNITFVEIWDTRNKTEPELKRSLDFEGSYNTSRKIKNQVYFVLNSYRYYYPMEGDVGVDERKIVPSYRVNGVEGKRSDFEPIVRCADVGQILPRTGYGYLTIVSLPIDEYNRPIGKKVLFGSSENVYASQGNLYIANTNYESSYGILEEVLPGSGSSEETTVYKFALSDGKITYTSQGKVPGHILNQFSMDEHAGYFRIATTVGRVSRFKSKSANNVYVLEKGMGIVGALEGLAPGEKIYSARFMGDRGYLVTFKKVDPFFALDLSDPRNPRMVGKLKIPGYSDYLHPFDENHIIGLGKATEEALSGDFVWYQGLKIAIFDVSDLGNPRQLYKTEIGDRGSDSYALYDHKAFLFDRKRNLLVIPVLLAEIPEAQKMNSSREANVYGENTFQGAYVYRLTLDEGFKLLGRVTHYDGDFTHSDRYYYYGDPYNIKRTLYIDDYLYTISERRLGINHLFDLKDSGKVAF